RPADLRGALRSVRQRVQEGIDRGVVLGRPCHDAAAFPSRGRSSGDLPLMDGAAPGSTNELPSGPAWTAWCSALPPTRSFHERNHTVQPLSHVPPRGLPVMLTGSPGNASL